MVKNARRFYSVISVAEAVTWTMLILAMIAEYGLAAGDLPVRIAGSIHGFGFLLFVVTTLLIAVNNRWKIGYTLLALVAAVIPWATLAFDAFAQRKNLISEHWRMLAEGFQPQTAGEKITLLIVRNPVVSALLILVLVSALFVTLLWLGPPTEWGSRF